MSERTQLITPRDETYDLRVGRATILAGADRGLYPAVNSLLLQGRDETLLIDPGVTLVAAGGISERVDRVLNSHGHEDHVAGNCLFDDAHFHAHEADVQAIRNLDGLMEIYGMGAAADAEFRETVLDEFSYVARPDASGFEHGDVFDVGDSTLTVVHLPGHTRGHCGFLIEPESVMYVADIDLTGFGPYYGDAWSDLDDFEASIEACKTIDADLFVTAHHKFVVEGREQFRERITEYQAIIDRRDQALLEMLAEPKTLDQIADHRFIYRPHVELGWVHEAESRSAAMHLARLVPNGAVTEIEPGIYRAG